MNDSCVKISYLEDRELEISFILADFLFHPRPRKFRNVRCFECKLRATMGPLEIFENRVVVG